MYKLPAYFDIKELVSPIVYNRFKDDSWMFFEENILKDLLLIRETWQSPIIINNWSSGGSLKQCGLRSNLDKIPMDKTKNRELYLSGHTQGKAFDLHDKLGRNLKLYNHVLNLVRQSKFKSFQRIEDWNKTCTSGGWIHVDSLQRKENQYTF